MQKAQPVAGESQLERETMDNQEELSEDAGGRNLSEQKVISSEEHKSMDDTDASINDNEA